MDWFFFGQQTPMGRTFSIVSWSFNLTTINHSFDPKLSVLVFPRSHQAIHNYHIPLRCIAAVAVDGMVVAGGVFPYSVSLIFSKRADYVVQGKCEQLCRIWAYFGGGARVSAGAEEEVEEWIRRVDKLYPHSPPSIQAPGNVLTIISRPPIHVVGGCWLVACLPRSRHSAWVGDRIYCEDSPQ